LGVLRSAVLFVSLVLSSIGGGEFLCQIPVFSGQELRRDYTKCIVVDERRALVTSANFTKRAQTRNIEVGVLIEDEHFARALVHQWRSAAEAGVFVAVKSEGP
jgi:hypothetical protein